MASGPGLTQQDGRAQRVPYCKRDQQEQRPEHDQDPHRAEYVNGALGPPAQRRHCRAMPRGIAGLVRESMRVATSACQRARLASMWTPTACLAHTMSAPDRLRELLNEGA